LTRSPLAAVAPLGGGSFHHGDIDRYRGGPPAFWEIDPATGYPVFRFSATLATDQRRRVQALAGPSARLVQASSGEEIRRVPIEHTARVTDENGVLVWAELRVLQAPPRLTEFVMEPGDQLRFKVIWNLRDIHGELVKPGRYFVSGTASILEEGLPEPLPLPPPPGLERTPVEDQERMPWWRQGVATKAISFTVGSPAL
jgi:hypothetical protein